MWPLSKPTDKEKILEHTFAMQYNLIKALIYAVENKETKVAMEILRQLDKRIGIVTCSEIVKRTVKNKR